ncbi:MAG TPA: oligopeptidase A [Gammaproteobacteria bacterium]|nr:oligopeptidase A [Gammaproteobacteria bacterium]
MTNPLLENYSLPPFSRIEPEHVEPAIDRILADNRAALKTLLAQPPSWETLILPLDDNEDRLSRAWSPVRHMNSVVNSEALREAYNRCLPKLSEYGVELGQNRDLFNAYKQIADSADEAGLTASQRKVLENALRDFHLSGVDLEDDKKARFAEISKQLSELSAKFEENVLDATNAWSKHVEDSAGLSGLPDSALEMLRQEAARRGLGGAVITLQYPSYLAIMTYADDRQLREEVYRAYVTRASDQGDDPALDNSEIIERILALKHESSRLLGFANYAERSLSKKMAESPEKVMAFLEDLADRARPRAQSEYDDLARFARGVLGYDEVQAWDVAYISEKMKGAYFALSQEDLKPYFPVDQVIDGLFTLVNRLYGIEIRQREGVDVWHPDVRFYDIFDRDGNLQAQFYFDLYARENKRGGAWMDDCVGRRRTSEGIQIPVAFMTCNSSPPVGDKPALFTHDEVITLFHEFGHGLHHMLTRIDESDVAGISGVEWDAVELPSQFMENWCWEREVLDMFARRYDTGEPLPDALYDKLIASKNFQAAMQMVRQLEFAIFDMRIHAEYDPEKGARALEILDQVRDQVAVFTPPEYNRFPHSFSHIFGGGYAAGYYSYKWAEVLSADAFARFEEEGLFNPRVGADFLEQVLERGGSRDAMASFKAFRGREPTIDALLRHSGLEPTES